MIAPVAQVRVRRIHRRDLNRVWDFLKLVFRDVNRETVEYQRPRSKKRFLETYEQEGIEQLLFVVGPRKESIVGYAECTYEISGADNWLNERYFQKRDMRPLFVDELAVHPEYQGQGIGQFILDQLEHLARIRGCTHVVLEVAENNENALSFYRTRNFYKLDAAIFLAKKVPLEDELLPPRPIRRRHKQDPEAAPTAKTSSRGRTSSSKRSASKKAVAKAEEPKQTEPAMKKAEVPAAKGAGAKKAEAAAAKGAGAKKAEAPAAKGAGAKKAP